MEGLLLRSILVSAFGLTALLAAARGSASVRHAIVTATLFGLLLMPLIQVLLPQMPLPVLPADKITVSLEGPAAQSIKPIAEPEPSLHHPYNQGSSFDWSRLWLLGCAAGGARLFCGWGLLVWRLRKARTIKDAGSFVPVFESDAVTVPVTTWIGRPIIVLPLSWQEWPEERLSIVLKHEEAHVRRGDWFSLVAARLTQAIFWPNPLVWLLAHLQSGLTEQAVDGLVVSEGVPAWRYADELLAIAQEARATGLPLALSMGHKAEVARRIEMLLKQKRLEKGDLPWLRPALCAVSLLAAVPIAICGFTTAPQAQRQSLASQSTPTPAVGVPQPVQSNSDIQFVLSCWIYKPAAIGDLPLKAYPTEPKQLEKGLGVLGRPEVWTFDRLRSALTYNRTGGGAGDWTRIELLPIREANGRVSMHVSVSAPSAEKGHEVSTLLTAQSSVQPGGWLAMSVPVPGSSLKQLFVVNLDERKTIR